MRPGHVVLASNRVNAMANKTLRTTAKVAKKTAPMRVAAKAARQPTHTDEADAESTAHAKRAAMPGRHRAGGERNTSIKAATHVGKSASQLISSRIAELGDWRGDVLRHVRELIEEADPEIIEEWKWRGTPVWSHDGGICTGESYKEVVKLTFFKGASLADPAGLFNSSLEGNVHRAIDIRERDEIDASAFKNLIRAAVSLNRSGKKK